MDEGTRSGTERAAMLLLTLGEEQAASVMRHLGPEEVQRLGSAMAGLQDVTREQVARALEDLLATVEEQSPIGLDTEQYLRKVLTSSFGDRKAGSFLGRIFKRRQSAGIETLKWMDAQEIAHLIGREHPQIIAIVLAHLSASQAADVLAEFPLEQQTDIAMRIAQLEEVPETALKELDAIVDERTQDASSHKKLRLGGVRAAADILNLLEGGESRVLEAIAAEDETLSEKIRDSLFVFENLLDIDDRGIQTLLRSVQTETLGVALRGADVAIQEKIFRNMSKRAAEILRDDMAAKGPVKLSDVEAAQKEILMAVQQLAEEGQIVLGGRGERLV